MQSASFLLPLSTECALGVMHMDGSLSGMSAWAAVMHHLQQQQPHAGDDMVMSMQMLPTSEAPR